MMGPAEKRKTAGPTNFSLYFFPVYRTNWNKYGTLKEQSKGTNYKNFQRDLTFGSRPLHAGVVLEFKKKKEKKRFYEFKCRIIYA